MKRPGRVLPAAAVVLLGALGLAVAGCSRQQPEQQSVQPVVQQPAQLAEPPAAVDKPCSDRTTEGVVTVFVKFENDKAITENKWIYICKDWDRVQWVSCDGDFEEPRFEKDSPFDTTDKYEKGEKKLKSPKAKKAGKFDYKIKLVRGGTPVEVDPRIEVMP